jgi:hypothetical protein
MYSNSWQKQVGQLSLCVRKHTSSTLQRITATAKMGLGLGCNKAHHYYDCRDRTQNSKAQATKLKQDIAEKDAILATLTLFDDRKKRYEEALKD